MATLARASTPRVSIGLPVYNGERYLEAALDSILGQTFTDFELVISDNASTDATECICRAYAARDSRIRYLRNERNVGLARNFGRVFHLAQGEYFRWHCYDDVCAPMLLERCVATLDRMPAVILCYGRTMLIDELGQELGPYDEGLNLCWHSPYRRYLAYHQHYRDGALVNVQYGLLRSAVLRRTQLIAPFVDADVALIGDLALRGEFRELPECLFYSRQHPLMTTQAFRTARERLALFDPSNKRGSIHPLWRLLAEHFAIVSRAPISAADRLRCYLVVARCFYWKAGLYLQHRLAQRRLAGTRTAHE